MKMFPRNLYFLRILLFTALMVSSIAARAETVEEILQMKKEPVGVVFEIVSNNQDELAKVLPTVQKDIQRLHKRFPGLDIAVVSHGMEQFALTRKNQSKYSKTNQEVQSLAKDPNTTFHVCGAFAAMHNVSPEDFPDYVDVAAHGPLQIQTYMDFGYLKVKID
jgi:intracellular sulfur oxidation DsrE/DsrF family protein